jgi:hypothetical protein
MSFTVAAKCSGVRRNHPSVLGPIISAIPARSISFEGLHKERTIHKFISLITNPHTNTIPNVPNSLSF